MKTPDLKSVESFEQAPSFAQILKNGAAHPGPLINRNSTNYSPLGKMVSLEPPLYTYVQGKEWVPPDRTADKLKVKRASNIDLFDKNKNLNNSTSNSPQTTSE